jgi:hypothetical protein
MKIKAILLNLILITGLTAGLQAQNNANPEDSASINQLILTLFDGMREGDSAKVSKVFRKDVKMFSSFTTKEGQKVLREGKLESFLKAIGTPHDEIWDERIWDTQIAVDGGIAQVWTQYAFYIGSQFSHCGVDAFDLVKDASGQWKIIHLMDTRRMEGCDTEE